MKGVGSGHDVCSQHLGGGAGTGSARHRHQTLGDRQAIPGWVVRDGERGECEQFQFSGPAGGYAGERRLH